MAIWYHGTEKHHGTLKVQTQHTFGTGASRTPLFFSPDKAFARMYAQGPEGVIYTARLTLKKTFSGDSLVHDDARYWPPEYDELTTVGKRLYDDLEDGKVFSDIDADDVPETLAYIAREAYDIIETTEFKRWLKRNGYDSAYVTGDGPRNVFVFSPKQVDVIKVEPAH